MRNYRKLPWLLSLMPVSPVKTQTKADLRAEAMARFKVSRNAFDAGWDGRLWTAAIVLGGNRSSVRKTRRPRQDCVSGETGPVTPFPSDPRVRAGFAGARGSQRTEPAPFKGASRP
jgi:hypothetical protein